MSSIRLKKIGISIGLVAIFSVGSLSAMAGGTFSSYVDNKGNISFPKNFRTTMVHLGSWFIPEGGVSGFHDVYTEKRSVEIFRKTGKFPDGATLVKELRPSKAGDYTTGNGVHHATENLRQWFVMIKDTKGRFASNPLWGNGWGWALFKPDNTAKNIAANYEVDCLGCHVPAEHNDWVYTEGYPILGE